MLHCKCNLRSLQMLPAFSETTPCFKLPQARQQQPVVHGFSRNCMGMLQVDRQSAPCCLPCEINGISIVQDSVVVADEIKPCALKQRTDEWQELRQGRLTASSFSSALGFWGIDRRVELWEEKLGLRLPFSGNAATEWGVSKEAVAVERYQEITGNVVQDLAFKIYKEGDDVQGWLGASPDGLINEGAAGVYEKGGILEVKCPHNKGRPELCLPWVAVPYYYIPQVQGLMEILNRDWLDLFVWTLNGSAVFRVDRNLKYWSLIFGVLSDFWWASVVPGKQVLSMQKKVDVNIYRPIMQHRLISIVLNESRQLAAKAVLVWKEPV